MKQSTWDLIMMRNSHLKATWHLKMKTFGSTFHRIRKVRSTKLLVRIYMQYIERIITYGILTYGTSSKTDLQNFHSQREKNSFIFSKKKLDHFSRILDEFFVLMPQELYVMELSNFLKRCLSSFFWTHPLEFDGYKQCRKNLKKRRVTF